MTDHGDEEGDREDAHGGHERAGGEAERDARGALLDRGAGERRKGARRTWKLGELDRRAVVERRFIEQPKSTLRSGRALGIDRPRHAIDRAMRARPDSPLATRGERDETRAGDHRRGSADPRPRRPAARDEERDRDDERHPREDGSPARRAYRPLPGGSERNERLGERTVHGKTLARSPLADAAQIDFAGAGDADGSLGVSGRGNGNGSELGSVVGNPAGTGNGMSWEPPSAVGNGKLLGIVNGGGRVRGFGRCGALRARGARRVRRRDRRPHRGEEVPGPC